MPGIIILSLGGLAAVFLLYRYISGQQKQRLFTNLTLVFAFTIISMIGVNRLSGDQAHAAAYLEAVGYSDVKIGSVTYSSGRIQTAYFAFAARSPFGVRVSGKIHQIMFGWEVDEAAQ